MAYITLAQLKLAMQIDTTADDAVLTRYPDAVTAAINSFCHRHFEPEGGAGGAANHPHTFTPLDIYDNGDLIDSATLWLKHDLAELTSITNGDGTTIPLTDVVTLPMNRVPIQAIRIKSASMHTWTYSGSPEGSVIVTGKWCYSTAVPDDIVEAALEWAKHMYDLRLQAINTQSDAIVSADGVIFASPKMPGHVRQLLYPYVKRSRS